MFLFKKLFKVYIFCFLEHSVGRYIFELFAHETNLKKKRSVRSIHGQALLLDSYVVKKFLRSVQHEAGNLGPKLQPRGGFFGP